MNASETLFLAIGLVALFVGGYYLYTQQPTQQSISIPQVEWQTPSAARVGDEISVSITISNGQGTTVALAIDDATLTQPCSTNPCQLIFTHVFSRPGVHPLSLRVNDYAFTRGIAVTDTLIRCLDGTKDGACSLPPQQCVNGKLVDNCTACGCPSGKICASTQCVSSALQFNIGILASVIQGSTAQVSIPLQNNSSVAADGLFLVYVDVYDNAENLLASVPQQVRLDSVAPSASYTTQATVVLPIRSARIGAKLYSITPEGNPNTLLGSTTQTFPLAIAFDDISPTPPTNVRVTQEDDSAVLRWDASSSGDVSGYVIYRQNFGSQQFITYSILAEVTATQYVLPSAAESLLYTVRAKDFSGNLSDPTRGVEVAGNAT